MKEYRVCHREHGSEHTTAVKFRDWGGRLTAEQVRELIAPHLDARPTFDFGRHGAVWSADFQAIADELNAALGGDDKSRWHEMFGAPERAAQTLEKAELETLDYCAMVDHRCDECRYEFDRYGCCDPTPLLEWLRGDAE